MAMVAPAWMEILRHNPAECGIGWGRDRERSVDISCGAPATLYIVARGQVSRRQAALASDWSPEDEPSLDRFAGIGGCSVVHMALLQHLRHQGVAG